MAAENIDALNLNITSSATTESVDKLIDSLTRLGSALDKLKSKNVSVNIKQTGAASATAAGNMNKLGSSFASTAIKATALICCYLPMRLKWTTLTPSQPPDQSSRMAIGQYDPRNITMKQHRFQNLQPTYQE